VRTHEEVYQQIMQPYKQALRATWLGGLTIFTPIDKEAAVGTIQAGWIAPEQRLNIAANPVSQIALAQSATESDRSRWIVPNLLLDKQSRNPNLTDIESPLHSPQDFPSFVALVGKLIILALYGTVAGYVELWIDVRLEGSNQQLRVVANPFIPRTLAHRQVNRTLREVVGEAAPTVVGSFIDFPTAISQAPDHLQKYMDYMWAAPSVTRNEDVESGIPILRASADKYAPQVKNLREIIRMVTVPIEKVKATKLDMANRPVTYEAEVGEFGIDGYKMSYEGVMFQFVKNRPDHVLPYGDLPASLHSFDESKHPQLASMRAVFGLTGVYYAEFNPEDTLDLWIDKTIRMSLAAMPITESTDKSRSLWTGVSPHSGTMTGAQVNGTQPEASSSVELFNPSVIITGTTAAAKLASTTSPKKRGLA
jgi:hypothetical protein